MVDLSIEASELWASLGARTPGRARVVQIVSARSGAGVSTVARELALVAARKGGQAVWLIDADLPGAGQFEAISQEQDRFGAVGGAVAASPDGTMFFSVQPPTVLADGRAAPDAAYLTGHRLGQLRLWVTRFEPAGLSSHQGLHVLSAPGYWDAMRRHADLIVVDCPAVDRSQTAISLAPQMDQAVLVVSADDPDVRGQALLRDQLQAAGAKVAGLFLNRAVVDEPAFLKAILP